MFCPLGFRSATSIMSEVFANSFDECFESAKVFANAHDIDGSRISDSFFSIGPMDWVEFDFFRSFGSHICIASPSGVMMKLDTASIRYFTDWHGFSIHEVYRANDFPQELFHEQNLFDLPIEDFTKDYAICNPDKFQNPWDFASRLNLDKKFMKCSMFHERQGMTISLKAFRYFSGKNYIELDEFGGIAKILEPFEGWSLCVKEDVVSKILENISVSSSEPNHSVRDFSQNEKSHTIKFETQAFKELSKTLSSGTWTGTNTELRRTLPYELGQRPWLRVLGKLREKYPEISKPGRKSKKS